MLRIIKALVENISISIIQNISGSLGERIRRFYYTGKFLNCGTNVKIGVGVIFENIENISIGDNVCFLPYSIITGPTNKNRPSKRLYYNAQKQRISEYDLRPLVIGNEVAIGSYNIIQGYGGLIIHDRVTTSARVSIYSFSHIHYAPDACDLITYSNAMVNGPIACIVTPMVVYEGAWLGLGVSVFGADIGRHCFITAHSVVTRNLPKNMICTGSPALPVSPRFQNPEI